MRLNLCLACGDNDENNMMGMQGIIVGISGDGAVILGMGTK